MRQKALEMQKTETLARIEMKLDMLAKKLGVDFGATPEPEPVVPVAQPEPVQSDPIQQDETPKHAKKNK